MIRVKLAAISNWNGPYTYSTYGLPVNPEMRAINLEADNINAFQYDITITSDWNQIILSCPKVVGSVDNIWVTLEEHGMVRNPEDGSWSIVK